MRATIANIHESKVGTDGVKYVRVEFMTPEGGWYKTDLCSGYRNWKRWKDHLEIGVTLEGLELKGANTVNADSYPVRVTI
jgi:hypothetical protein